MLDQALQPIHPVLWNRIPLPSFSSPEPSNQSPPDTYNLQMQTLSPDISTSSSSGGTPFESHTLHDMFLNLPESFDNIRTVQNVPRPTDHPRRPTKACRECKRRKVKCGENKNVQFHEQRGRSALLTQDQCHRASRATTSELLDELRATKMELFKKDEELKEMRFEIERLKEDKKELLERLGHPSVRVSGCCAYLTHSDDLTPHQATSYIQHGIWYKDEECGESPTVLYERCLFDVDTHHRRSTVRVVTRLQHFTNSDRCG